jgi:F-type H+-transporting ATPase subunit epsilon
MPLTLRVVTPEKALVDAVVDHVTLHAVDGELGLRPGHLALVAQLKPGHVVAKANGLISHALAVRGGVAQVHQDVVTVLAEAAIDSDRIDPATVDAALSATAASTASTRARDLAYLQAQRSLPRRQASLSEQQTGARAAVDAARHH